MSTSQTVKVAATPRTVIGKQVSRLRLAGELPAVVYGNGKTPQNISVNAKEFTHLFETAGSTTLLDLAIEGGKALKVLVHDVQVHGTRRHLLHVDFLEVNLKEKLKTNVPLIFTGEAEAIESLEGSLNTVKDEVEVECLPQDLIHEITVDISTLKTFDDVIRVGDLSVPAGVVILDDAEELVASITEPRSEAEMEALEGSVEDGSVTTEFETEDGATKAPSEEKAE